MDAHLWKLRYCAIIFVGKASKSEEIAVEISKGRKCDTKHNVGESFRWKTNVVIY